MSKTDTAGTNKPETNIAEADITDANIAEADAAGIKTEDGKKSNKEFIRTLKFIGFSISAGVIEILMFTLLNEVFRLPYWVSYLTALVCSVLWNFTFNRKFTFKSASNVPVAMLKVFAYYCVLTPLTTLLEHYLTSIGWNEYLVTFINMVINFVTEYFYQRFYVFRDSIDTNDAAKKEGREKVTSGTGK